MQVVVLAAGLGSRLGALTRALPKALIEVGGRPLIDYALAFARAAGATEIAVVGGYCAAELGARVAAVDPGATFVDNPDYRKGNLLSLLAGLPAIDPARGFLHMNTDHIYRPSIAALVGEAAAAATEVTAFCDFDRDLGADDMKVALGPDREVRAMSKQLDAWDAGYVGMSYIPGSRAADHRAAADAALAAQGDAIHVESVLVELAGRGAPPAIADISGHGWLEVDEPHERDQAEATLAAERWWDDRRD
jgi:choline kinase